MDIAYTHLRSLLTPLYGAGEASAIAKLVLAEAFGIDGAAIYADNKGAELLGENKDLYPSQTCGKNSSFPLDAPAHFQNICKRLASGEPVQYILGTATFCSRPLAVTPDVLIPRPETEELVAWVVKKIKASGERAPHILDAGTGSGCIAISLKLALPEAMVTAWDISDRALTVARKNAQALCAEVRFEREDILAPTTAPAQPYTYIISNPPYIRESEREAMHRNVTDYEPATALFVPNENPLLFYNALSRLATTGWLTRGGWLMVEVNRSLAADVASLFEAQGLEQVPIRRDQFGNERMVAARLP